MDRTDSFRKAMDVTRHQTGIVIPVFFPEGVDTTLGETLLKDTVVAYCDQVSDPAWVCLSLDGEAFGLEIVKRMAEGFGVSTSVTPVNKGKLQAIRSGARCLLESKKLDYLAVVDQDGDHFANELVNFIRTAEHIVHHAGTDGVLVLGQRVSRHRPMGFLRGELEEFADRVLVDILSYRAVIKGRPLRLEYAHTLGEFPDFHSGYKVFLRSTAEAVFLGEENQAGVTETCYYRHACEAVLVVEALEYGAYLGVVNRSTFNEQPITTFGLYNRTQLMADKIIWPCKRLEIPRAFVKQWMANHIPRLVLGTLAPEGREELKAIWQLVLEAFGEDVGGDEEDILNPLFV